MSRRAWVTTWLSPLALSNAALAWATVIGGFSTLVLVPGTAGLGSVTWPWLGVVVASQAAFALVVLVVRSMVRVPGPWTVLVTLAVAGVVRGAIIAVGASLVGIAALSATSLIGRALNSAVISVIGVALIGATLTWRADFRAHYRLLRERAVLLGNAASDGEVIEPTVLDAWTSMKGGLDTTLREAGERLAAGASEQDLREAADLITAAIDVDLRPAARAMWQDAIPEEQPLRLSTLLVATLARWHLPLRDILAFLAVVVGVGSVVRSGLVAGGAYTLRYVLVTGLVLWASTALARAYPRRAPLIAVLTLLLLPAILLAIDYEVGDVLLGLPEDPIGQVVVAVQTPITVVLIAMGVEAVRDRQQVLAALQARIDAEAADLRRRDGAASRDARRLSLFVHHSVQSELSALAIQVREAASTRDPATMEEVRCSALERLQRLEALDAHAPPWLRHEDGRERIDQVVDAWTGILDVTMELPADPLCRADQWHLAAQVIEEGLANAARHGEARTVRVCGTVEAGALVLRLADDGVAAHTAGQALAGLGSQWLDRVAPGEWSREQSVRGSVLTVRLR